VIVTCVQPAIDVQTTVWPTLESSVTKDTIVPRVLKSKLFVQLVITVTFLWPKFRVPPDIIVQMEQLILYHAHKVIIVVNLTVVMYLTQVRTTFKIVGNLHLPYMYVLSCVQYTVLLISNRI
jgi:hypothetical protein